MPRLQRLRTDRRRTAQADDAIDAEPAKFIERIVEALDETGADGALYAELRFGIGTLLRP